MFIENDLLYLNDKNLCRLLIGNKMKTKFYVNFWDEFVSIKVVKWWSALSQVKVHPLKSN